MAIAGIASSMWDAGHTGSGTVENRLCAFPMGQPQPPRVRLGNPSVFGSVVGGGNTAIILASGEAHPAMGPSTFTSPPQEGISLSSPTPTNKTEAQEVARRKRCCTRASTAARGETSPELLSKAHWKIDALLFPVGKLKVWRKNV